MTGGGRLLWPDAAKGVCITLVVLLHVTSKDFAFLPWASDLVVMGWRGVSAVLQPIRMPLFFLISGFLVAASLARPWRQITVRRIWSPYYLYLVWLLIHAAFPFWGSDLGTERLSAGDLLPALVVGFTSLWYLYALAAYYVIARASSSLPACLPVAGATALAVVATTGMLPERGNTVALLGNLVFFLIGVRLPAAVDRLTRWASASRALAAGAAFLVVSTAVRWAELHDALAVSTVLGGAGVLAGIICAVAVSDRLPRLAAPLAKLGQRTFPVYVLHLPALAVLHEAMAGLSAQGGAAAVLAFAYPAAATTLLIAVCLALQWFLTKCGVGLLFAWPAPRRVRVPAR